MLVGCVLQYRANAKAFVMHPLSNPQPLHCAAVLLQLLFFMCSNGELHPKPQALKPAP